MDQLDIDLRQDRFMRRHGDVPGDVVAAQIAEVDRAVHLLGDDPELADVADLAIDHNLGTFGTAVHNGAGLIGAEPGGPEDR